MVSNLTRFLVATTYLQPQSHWRSAKARSMYTFESCTAHTNLSCRQEPGKNKSVEFRELTDPAYNIACPVKLLLIFALRTGAVPETSWAQLRANAKDRSSQRVVWTTPTAPVFCQPGKGSAILKVGAAAETDSCLKTLRLACDKLGLLDTPRLHDLRRGAAYEQRALGKQSNLNALDYRPANYCTIKP